MLTVDVINMEKALVPGTRYMGTFKMETIKGTSRKPPPTPKVDEIKATRKPASNG